MFTAPDPNERSARTYAIAGLIGLALAIGVGRFAFTPVFPVMQSDAALSVADGAWLATANYLGYFVGALAALAVNARASTLIRAALLINVAATIGMGFTHAFAAWIAWRGLAGVASAFLFVFISALSLQQLAALGRPTLGAAVFSGVGAGIFTVGTLCLGLDHLGVSASAIWIALGVLCAVLSVFVWPAFTDDSVAIRAERVQQSDPRRPRAWRLITCYALFGFGYIIPATFLPVMAKAVVADGWAFGVSWPVFGLAAFASTFVVARASRLASGLGIWRFTQIMMAFGVALPAFFSSLAAVICAALCVGGTFMVITMVAMQTAKLHAGPHPRRLMAAMTAAFAGGQLAGPLGVWWLVESSAGFSTILLTAAVSLILGAGLLFRRSVSKRCTAIESIAGKVGSP